MILVDMAIVALLLSFFAAATGLAALYAIRWYDLSIKRLDPGRIWMDAALERGWRPLRTYLAELLYMAVYALFYIPGIALWLSGRRGSIPGAKGSRQAAPLVVLVHGLLGTGANLWALKWRLAIRGVKNIAIFDYATTAGTFEEKRDLLRDFIIMAAERTGSEGVVLIGHSMGGLIAHAYACEYGAQRGGVLGLFTLGSPMRGSRVAALGLSHSARAMHPSNPYFTTAVANRPQAPFVCAGTVYDQLVIPFTNAEHPMADRFDLVDGCGHSGLLYDAGAFAHLMEFLRQVLEKPETGERTR